MICFSRLTVAAIVCALAPQAQAGRRAWVSSTGADSGTCLVTTPCRTFQYAHDHVDAGGEIDVKDSGGFGTLTVTKSVSVIAPDGVLATISLLDGGSAVDLSNLRSTDVVSLRGLTINGRDPNSGSGIAISTGRINIDHCIVRGTGEGIFVQGNAVAVITNNVLTGNGNVIYIVSGASTGVGGNIISNNYVGIANFTTSAYSYGDNKINANTSHDVYPSALPITSMR